MIYSNVISAIFISRPNRFIANVLLNGSEEIAHIKNTGRCAELFVRGAEVYLQVSNNPERKTKYDVIAVKKGDRIINIDSQIPNKVFGEYVEHGLFLDNVTLLKPEFTYKKSRFDFYIETDTDKIFVEVKGVTLDEDGVARFPDAPTERGIKHLNELSDAVNNGYKAYAVFVIQMKGIKRFEPNYKMHAAFGEALKNAANNGVNVIAYDCVVTYDSIMIDDELPVFI